MGPEEVADEMSKYFALLKLCQDCLVSFKFNNFRYFVKILRYFVSGIV